MMNWLRNLLTPVEHFAGQDFHGREEVVTVPLPSRHGPGYYEFEYIQDCGYGAMVCGPIIRAESFRDAVDNGQAYVRARGFACQFAFGNRPERVRRLPEELQSLSIEEATRRWKEYEEYNSLDNLPETRINPWRMHPLVTGKQVLQSYIDDMRKLRDRFFW